MIFQQFMKDQQMAEDLQDEEDQVNDDEIVGVNGMTARSISLSLGSVSFSRSEKASNFCAKGSTSLRARAGPVSGSFSV